MMATDLPLIVVSCGARKGSVPAPARDLYTGPYFRAMRDYAYSLAPEERIWVLSANYGLIPITWEIAPYNMRLSHPLAATPGVLAVQISAHQLTRWDDSSGVIRKIYPPVIALGGRAYVDLLRQVFSDVTAPLAGLGGIGRQIAWLREHTR